MSLTTAKYLAVQRDVTQKIQAGIRSADPLYPELCTVVNSSGADEKYGWVGGVPGMREWVGERQFKQLRAADYTLINKHWESSLEVLRTDVDDDRLAMIAPAAQQLGVEAAYHPDELLWDVLKAGESSQCFDGQFFYDTDHVWGDSGTQSNDLTYAAATGTDPTVAEFKGAFHQAVIQMLGFKNDQGKYLVRPRAGSLGSLIVTVPINQYEVANEVFAANLTGGGNTNVVLERPRVIPVQYYGSQAYFDLHYVGGFVKPFVMQKRMPLRVQSKGINDIEFKELKWMTEARYNVGYLAWWTSVRTTFT